MREFTVREARQRKRMTQDELAKASGLDQTTISDLETGRNSNPRLDTIRRLATALGVRPVQLTFPMPSPKAIGTRAIDRTGHNSSKAAVA